MMNDATPCQNVGLSRGNNQPAKLKFFNLPTDGCGSVFDTGKSRYLLRQIRPVDGLFRIDVGNFEVADIDLHWKLLDAYESEARRCLDAKLVLPGYDFTLKCSHVFNTLDARGAISVTERVGVIKRVRDLAVRCAQQYLASREELGFPLGRADV